MTFEIPVGWNCVCDITINLTDFLMIKDFWSYISLDYLLIRLFVYLFIYLSNAFS